MLRFALLFLLLLILNKESFSQTPTSKQIDSIYSKYYRLEKRRGQTIIEKSPFVHFQYHRKSKDPVLLIVTTAKEKVINYRIVNNKIVRITAGYAVDGRIRRRSPAAVYYFWDNQFVELKQYVNPPDERALLFQQGQQYLESWDTIKIKLP